MDRTQPSSDSNIAQFYNEISGEFLNQARIGFRILPDALLSGALFLTCMLGWQPSLASYALGILVTGFTQGAMSEWVRNTYPTMLRAGGALGGGANNCSGHFPGTNWSRLFTIAEHPRDLIEGSTPSYYMMVMGFTLAYVSVQEYLFKEELAMRPGTAKWLKTFNIITFIAIIALGCLRIAISCESWGSVILSTLFGCIIGFIFIACLVRFTDRRSVNILQIPLLEKRIPNKKPIYVCADIKAS